MSYFCGFLCLVGARPREPILLIELGVGPFLVQQFAPNPEEGADGRSDRQPVLEGESADVREGAIVVRERLAGEVIFVEQQVIGTVLEAGQVPRVGPVAFHVFGIPAEIGQASASRG